MKKLIFPLVIFFSTISAIQANNLSVTSPDTKVKITVKLTDRIYYNLQVDDKEVMWFSPLSMKTSLGNLGVSPILISSKTTSINDVIKTVWGNRSEVKNNYNELVLTFSGNYSVIFRAYNDGIAYRFQSDSKGELIVNDEEVEYRFVDNYPVITHIVSGFESSYEKFYTRQKIQDIKTGTLVGTPAIINQPNLKLAVLESDIFEYPGMYLTRGKHDRNYINGIFPKYPVKSEQGGHNSFNMVVTERANFLAKTTGKRSFPWRALAVARKDIDLVGSDLVYKLARPAAIETNWIRPGKVAWDWWNAMNLKGVDFETGVNNDTYKYFIDFAAKNNIEYVIMDEGWSDQFDVLLPTPKVDMEMLAEYARQKNVKLILWAIWHTIDRQYKEAFSLFEKWGIAGVKIDFIDRDDQIAIDYYERIAKEAAKYKLLIDYHGCTKPAGLQRTYPNVINFEAVRGNEYNKFSEGVTPEHNVDIVFARMMAGPIDYTPGAMRNSAKGDFHASFENPVSCGTKAHQLGMYIVYFAPLQMLCDAPTAYEQHPDILKFLSTVPTTWDETIPLSGKIGEYVVVARKKGNNWYIGGLNNWTERDVEIDLSLLIKGNAKAEMLIDGINANRLAGDYKYIQKQMNSNDKITVRMKQGGGFAIKITQQ